MKTLKELLKEISILTFTIENKYPGLYQYLDESPMTIPDQEHPHIDTEVLSKYLETLKAQLEQHIKTHDEKK